MTVIVPDDGALDALAVLMKMTDEFFKVNRENLSDEVLDTINVKIEMM